MKLTPKQKLTIFTISDWMAHTQKQEIEVVTVLETPESRQSYQSGPVVAYRVGTMKPRGKRKEFHLDVSKDSALVFDGWDLPIITDAEAKQGSFSGNACFNLALREPASEPRLDAIFLRAFISEKALNTLTDDIRGKCICVRAEQSVTADGELIWPTIDIGHAVIQRMKEKVAA